MAGESSLDRPEGSRAGFFARLAPLQRLIRDRRGNIAVIAAACLPLLMGFAGLGIDTIQWVLTKRQLQQAVDGAAMAGVYSLIQTGDPQAAADNSLGEAYHLDSRASVEVDNPAPSREKDPYAVLVRVTVPAKLTFSGLFMSKPLAINAEATATVVQTGQYCAFAMTSDSDTGILVQSNAQIKGDCGIASNASSKDSIKIEGNASVAVGRLVSFGGIDGQKTDSSMVRSYGLRQTDPLENTEPPPIPTSGCPNVTVNSDTGHSVTLEPGCYGNMALNGSVHLQDGEYILNRGSFVVGSTANVSCSACTIFVTSDDPEAEPGSIGNIQIDEHATVQLSAPTQGPDAGIVLYQDRHAGTHGNSLENVIGGNGFSKIKGLVYTPAEDIRVNGNFNSDVSCARFIGRRLILQGQVYMATDCSNSNIITFRGTEVELVG